MLVLVLLLLLLVVVVVVVLVLVLLPHISHTTTAAIQSARLVLVVLCSNVQIGHAQTVFRLFPPAPASSAPAPPAPPASASAPGFSSSTVVATTVTGTVTGASAGAAADTSADGAAFLVAACIIASIGAFARSIASYLGNGNDKGDQYEREKRNRQHTRAFI